MVQQINLLDASLLVREDGLSARALLATLSCAALLVLGHYLYERSAWIRTLEQTATLTAPDPADADADGGDLSLQLAEAEAQLAARQQRQHAFSQLLNPPREPVQRLQTLIALLSPSMWLREVEFAGVRGMRLVGSSLDSADLAGYTARLGLQAAFAGQTVQVLKIERREQGPSAAAPPEAAASGARASDPRVVYEFELSTLASPAGETAP